MAERSPAEPMPPGELVSGPRGRRLCVEFMRAAEHIDDGEVGALGTALFWAGYVLDPGRGGSRVRLFATDDVSGSTEASIPREPSQDEAIEAAVSALSDAALPEASSRLLLEALTATVGAARYWQEPDGVDALAALSEARGALLRVAEHLVGAAAAQWWGDPAMLSPQFATVRDAETGGAPPSSRDAPRLLSAWAVEQRTLEERATRDRPADPSANWSGEWWSTPPRDLLRTTREIPGFGPVGLHLEEDSRGWEQAIVSPVSAKDAARVLEIDGTAAWAGLCRDFPLDVSAEKRHDWFRTSGRAGDWVMPDWSRVAEHWDAVHLTVRGYLAAAGTAIDCGAGRASMIAGWDPDASYWLRDAARAADTGETWHRSGADTHVDVDAWSRRADRP
ncbi:hypothetical protein [Leucobacter ruminantium]|uniref:Uncharacterized protein n=1 Tax=Leucobacter ruminantium TaxID=1289170 RepID=A0A939RUV0_9MICO|nr:hypothetical protein [Leucobacter ruminantium]MBO1806195.1 hypothetical protein [Leucobacter ruminantium]